MVARSDQPSLEEGISARMESQHGVMHVDQFATLGLRASAVRKRASAGRLHRVHLCVYSLVVPSMLGVRGWWMAAVLACGHGAVLSHRSAAALHDMRGGGVTTVDVSLPSRKYRSHSGIRVHRAASLTPADTTTFHDIPCTTVARTLLDRAATASHDELRRDYDEAEHLKILDVHAVDELLTRANGHHGAGRLRAVITDRAEPALTRTEIEDRMLALCRHAGLPRPLVNAAIVLADGETFAPDFHWPDRNLVVETDGRAVHLNPRAFEDDRRRDQHLRRAGYETLRVTWRQIANDGEDVGATLRAVLGV
jgi:predicted transcriptional regulator of viral defense system